MTDDIVYQLRGINIDYTERSELYRLIREAADEIERLRAEIDLWRSGALQIHYTKIEAGR